MGLYFGAAPQVPGSRRSGCPGKAADETSLPRAWLLGRQSWGPGGGEGAELERLTPSRDGAIMAAARVLPGSRKQAVRGGHAAGTRTGVGAGGTVGRAAGRPGAGRVRGVPADRGSRSSGGPPCW